MPEMRFTAPAKYFLRQNSNCLRRETLPNGIRCGACLVSLNPSPQLSDSCRITYTPQPARTYVGRFEMDSWQYSIDYDALDSVIFYEPGFNPQPTTAYNPFPYGSARFFENDTEAPSPPSLPFVFDDSGCTLSEYKGEGDSGNDYSITDTDGTDTILRWESVQETKAIDVHSGWGSSAPPASHRSYGVTITFQHSVKFKTVWTGGTAAVPNNQFILLSTYRYASPDVVAGDWQSDEYRVDTLSAVSAVHAMNHYRNTSSIDESGWGFVAGYSLPVTDNAPATITAIRS